MLDRQLQSTVAGFVHTPGTIVKIDEDSAQLRAALAGNTARIIITTLQKFPVVAEQAGSVAGSRFAVIVDEAHSSASGEAMKDMKKVLGGASTLVPADADPLTVAEQAEATIEAETGDGIDLIAESMTARGAHGNLAFFAFTATPKPKTLELFGELVTGADGEPVRVPFHLYSMRQAIEEGYILDVLANYTTYDTYYRLANTEPAEDPDVATSKASAALARFVSLHPTNLAQKAEIIVEHFRHKTAGKIGGRAKAMVVTRSRLHAVRYKQAIDAYLAAKGYDRGPGRIVALVAFSGTVIAVMDNLSVIGTGGPARSRPDRVLADKAYSSKSIRVHLRRRKIKTTIPEPSRQQTGRIRRGSNGGRPPAFDAEIYKQRNVVERAINKLRGTRAVATRYDKRDFVYRGAIDVASIRIWLRDPPEPHSRDTP